MQLGAVLLAHYKRNALYVREWLENVPFLPESVIQSLDIRDPNTYVTDFTNRCHHPHCEFQVRLIAVHGHHHHPEGLDLDDLYSYPGSLSETSDDGTTYYTAGIDPYSITGTEKTTTTDEVMTPDDSTTYSWDETYPNRGISTFFGTDVMAMSEVQLAEWKLLQYWEDPQGLELEEKDFESPAPPNSAATSSVQTQIRHTSPISIVPDCVWQRCGGRISPIQQPPFEISLYQASWFHMLDIDEDACSIAEDRDFLTNKPLEASTRQQIVRKLKQLKGLWPSRLTKTKVSKKLQNWKQAAMAKFRRR